MEGKRLFSYANPLERLSDQFDRFQAEMLSSASKRPRQFDAPATTQNIILMSKRVKLFIRKSLCIEAVARSVSLFKQPPF